jgi:hypothetical protein
MTTTRPEGGWCWTANDPEMTFPDPEDWLGEVGYYAAEPMIQRFDWGIPAPSTWLVAAWPDDGDKISKEFATEEEAMAFAAELRARTAEEATTGN